MRPYVERLIKDVVEAVGDPKFEKKDRPLCCSSPPLCEIATAFWLLRGGKVERSSFIKDFYVSVGSVSHAVFQRWAGRLGYLYGVWECQPCQERSEGVGPKICPKCHTEMEYVELDIDLGDLQGRADGLFVVKNKFIVFDLKFVGSSTLQKARSAIVSPVYYNQVNLYAYGLQLKGYPIQGRSLIYLSRDNPSFYYVHYWEGIDMEAVKTCLGIVRKVKAALKNPQRLPELRLACTTREEAESSYCSFLPFCFNDEIPVFRYLIELAKSSEKL